MHEFISVGLPQPVSGKVACADEWPVLRPLAGRVVTGLTHPSIII
jgi:hypothetical protein